MKTRVLRRALTFSNVIALLALFVALGGTSYAAVKLAKNSVTSKHIKNGQVKTADIRNGSIRAPKLGANAVTATKLADDAVTSSKLADNAVTGGLIDESTLGKVPSAGAADSAAQLDGYQRIYKRIEASDQTAAASQSAAMAAAPATTLATVGPFTLTAKCFAYDGSVYGKQILATSVSGAVLDSDEDDLYGDSDFLDTDTPEGDRETHSNSTSTNSADGYASHSSEWFAAAPGGTTVMGEVGTWVKNGTLTNGDGFYGAGDSCHFWGRVLKVS